MTRLRVVTEGDAAPGAPVAEAAKAAITEALANGMVKGVLIYANDDGGVGRVPILACIHAQRGLIIDADRKFDDGEDEGEFAK